MATVVAFHAHPDDEVLLAGGTLAGLARRGHRVVVVLATDGSAGLTGADAGAPLGVRRRAEAAAAGQALGVAATIVLDHRDSGMTGPVADDAFCAVDPSGPAADLATILEREAAEVLLVDDENGGYGHRDHRRAHAVGLLAAEIAGTPRVLEATVDRLALQRAARLVGWVPGLPDIAGIQTGEVYTAPARITHRVDITGELAAKRAGFEAHRSQHTGGAAEARTLAAFTRLPGPLFRGVFRHEWFVERGRPGGRPWQTSVL